jgi:hypothetical protein
MKSRITLILTCSLVLLLSFLVGCSLTEEDEFEPEEEKIIFPDELTIPSSDIKYVRYMYEYDGLFGQSSARLSIVFIYAGEQYVIGTEIPRSYDSAKVTNTITSVSEPYLLDTTKVPVLTALYDNWGIYGVEFSDHSPFKVTLEVFRTIRVWAAPDYKEQIDYHPNFKKITFEVANDTPFKWIQNGPYGGRKFYADMYYNWIPEEFPKRVNGNMSAYTTKPIRTTCYDISIAYD